MSKSENLLKQAAATIKQQESMISTLSSQNEDFKRRIAALEKEKVASQIADTMVDKGILDPDEKLSKVASLVELPDAEFKTTLAAVDMLSQAPTLGKLKDEEAPEMQDSYNPVEKVLLKYIHGEVD